MGGHGASLAIMRLKCLVKAPKAGPILLTHGDGPAGIFRARLTVNRAGFRNMTASRCSQSQEGTAALSHGQKKARPGFFHTGGVYVKRSGTRVGGTEGTRQTGAVQPITLPKYSGCHFSSFPLCPTWRRCVMAAGWVHHPPQEQPQDQGRFLMGRRLCLLLVEDRCAFCPFSL